MHPADDDFRIDTTFSGRNKNYAWPAAIVTAAVGLVLMILTMTTNFAAYLLPMDDEYLQVLVPQMADGSEPLALQMLEHEVTEKTMIVRGTVLNRTDFPVSKIVVVVDMQDTTGRFPQTVSVPVEPVELPSQGVGSFMAMATLQEKPAGYIVKFQIADGPFVPHRDERAATFGVTTK
jgi:hypothetical protein